MKKDKKQTLVPKLRFPEFREAGAWGRKKLGSLFSDRQETQRIDLPLLSLTEKEGIIPQENSNRKNSSNSDKSKYLRVVAGDIAYNTMRMWEGRSAFVSIEGLVSPAYTVCKPIENVSGLFFSYYFKTELLIEQFRKYSQGLVKDTLNLKYDAFSRIFISSPPLPEQQKIAECLTSLDELIAAESQQLDTLKSHKKGLMQQLFPREGETTPQLRFPEFQDAGEWEKKKLGDILLRPPDYGVNAPAATYSVELPTYIRITDIDEDGNFLRGSKVSVDIEPIGDNFLDQGDIALARTGASVGKSYQYREDDGRLVFAGFLIRLKPDPEKINSTFLSNFLKTERYWSWVRITSSRSGQPGLNSSEYASLTVPIPPEKETGLSEQQRIADFLSSLDDLISAQAEKIEALKQHKKGLMQQLFPHSN